MSEYWKSTPKYWCKFCKVFVKETKFEKEQHDATPRHQGNIQRSLRNLHRDNEREDRDKQRAKDEVIRLNGIVSGAPLLAIRKPPLEVVSGPPKQANPADLKRQLAQLAEMGIVVPKEYRAEMAMAGDWETVPNEFRVPPTLKEEQEDTKSLNIGVRKRKANDGDEAEEPEMAVRRGWGSTIKTYPGVNTVSEDIESLLKSKQESVKQEPTETGPRIKQEESVPEDSTAMFLSRSIGGDLISPKQEDLSMDIATPIVFKKRKGKIFKG